MKITCTKDEQEGIIRCFTAKHYCVANNPTNTETCWKCNRECVKNHIEWEITDEDNK